MKVQPLKTAQMQVVSVFYVATCQGVDEQPNQGPCSAVDSPLHMPGLIIHSKLSPEKLSR